MLLQNYFREDLIFLVCLLVLSTRVLLLFFYDFEKK